MSGRTFPVLNQQNCRQRDEVAMPRCVPWSFVEKFRDQAKRNHGQTLERLAERGGLAPDEMWLAFHGKRLYRDSEPPAMQAAIDWLNSELAKLHEPETSAPVKKETTDAK